MNKLLKFLILPSLTLVLFLGSSALRAEEPAEESNVADQSSLSLSDDSATDNWGWGGYGYGSFYCNLYPYLCGNYYGWGGDYGYGGGWGYGGWGGGGWGGGGWRGGWNRHDHGHNHGHHGDHHDHGGHGGHGHR